MNEQATTPEPSIAAEGAAGAAAVHGGQLLRQAREAAGVHIAALAVALKVPVRQIEALEQGRFDRLPDPTFVRALAGSLCRHLRIDPKPVLAQLPQALAEAPRVPEGINQPFHRPGAQRAPVVPWARVLRPAWLVAAGLLVAALLLLLWPKLLPPAADIPAPPAAEVVTPVPAAAPAAAATLPPGSTPGPGLAGVVVETIQPALPLPTTGAAPPAVAGSTALPRTTP